MGKPQIDPKGAITFSGTVNENGIQTKTAQKNWSAKKLECRGLHCATAFIWIYYSPGINLHVNITPVT